jgi:hypothetical protein
MIHPCKRSYQQNAGKGERQLTKEKREIVYHAIKTVTRFHADNFEEPVK